MRSGRLPAASRFLTSPLCLLALLCALLAPAQAQKIFTRDEVVGEKLDYDNQDIIVRGCTVTIDGPHSFKSLTIDTRGTVTHSPRKRSGLSLTISGNVLIQQYSALHADGCGFGPQEGPGAGRNGGSGNGGGASYGGEGTGGYAGAGPGVTYGSVKDPVDQGGGENLGSGGGAGDLGRILGGPGGGALRLTVAGTLQVDGRISAYGGYGVGNGSVGAGAGSGGSVYLNIKTVTGSGEISASGGDAFYYFGDPRGGRGGGGRIAIYYQTDQFAGTLSARGTGGSGAGTIYRAGPGQTQGDLIVDNSNVEGAATVLIGPQTFDNVRVRKQGKLAPPVGSLLDVTVLADLIVELGGYVTADARGYGPGQGVGAGKNGGTASGGGASYGGEGMDGRFSPASLGATYGSVKEPLDFGSGGGNGWSDRIPGGQGGGAIRIAVGGKLQVDGRISAYGGYAGGNSEAGGGGGSGGSLYLTIGTLAGSGEISAIGGDAFTYFGELRGGRGGGGRIAVYYQNDQFTGRLSARGTTGSGAGTVYKKGPGQTQGDLIIDNGGTQGGVTVPPGPQIFDNIFVRNRGVLAPAILGTLDLTALGNIVVDYGGAITASLRGYGPGQGPGKGVNGSANLRGSGGGYGGRGENAESGPGGVTYGSNTLPVDQGSGGGSGYGGAYGGGAGGGAIRLIARGTLQVDGVITTDGGYANYAGGGSGGSLFLTAGLFTGSPGGVVSAYGGYTDNGGGGGGGGRIALYFGSNTFKGRVSAAGQRGGQNGTVYTEQIASNLTVTLSVSDLILAGGLQTAGSVSLSAPAPAGGISVSLTADDPTLLNMTPSVTIPEGQQSALFTIEARPVTQPRTVIVAARLWDQNSSVTLTLRPWLAQWRVEPISIIGGANITATLSLSLPAPASGLAVRLSSSDGSVNAPATVTVPAGIAEFPVTLTTTAVTSARTVTLQATYQAENRTATLYVNPATALLRSITIAPASVVGGAEAAGIVRLTAPAPTGGVIVGLASADPTAASGPRAVTVPAGRASAAFVITTRPVSSVRSVVFTATLGTDKLTTLTVRLPGVGSLDLVPDELIGGDVSLGIVTLDAPPLAPVVVTIESDSDAATPDATLVIPAGETVGVFAISTSPVASQQFATITARANNVQRSQILTIDPVQE